MLEIFKKTVKDEKLTKIDKIEPGSWINVVEPNSADLERIKEYFKEAGDFLQDSQDPNEYPIIFKENGGVFILVRTPYLDSDRMKTIPLAIVVTKEVVLTISQKKLNFLGDIIKKSAVITSQKTKFLLTIFRHISEEYEYYTKRIAKSVYTKRVNLNRLKNTDIVNLVEFEEILNNYVNSLVPTLSVFEKLLSGRYVRIFDQDEDLIKDLLTDSRQTLVICKENLSTITNVRSAYSTIMTNELNKVIKFLTSVTIIVAVPTMIASIYGMNIRLPYEASPLAFWFLFLFATIITLFLVIVFYLKRWL